ncbi:MAG: ABC transporter ATP-binding protein, partial [Candidatus Heimdallarchaeota archaeon]|nr:ABC transporter ATP-binding protein [Candidatus Heimdallarchaeota archaeon]MCK5049632.1 ABC transporter ATP-binding protein [Candidatus Heimdallarchaeota archaeon]
MNETPLVVVSDRAEINIQLSEVSKIYDMGEVKVNALSKVSLQIPKGQFIVILGPSGSGKTTLLNLLGAIDVPSEGKVEVVGKELSKLNRKKLTKIRRNHVGFIFQFFNLLPSLTARENVEYALQIKGLNNTKKRAMEVLEQVGLAERADHFPGELSGGEQQRVAIARALAKSPEIILADEPTGNL